MFQGSGMSSSFDAISRRSLRKEKSNTQSIRPRVGLDLPELFLVRKSFVLQNRFRHSTGVHLCEYADWAATSGYGRL